MSKSFKVKPIKKDKTIWEKLVAYFGLRGLYTIGAIALVFILLFVFIFTLRSSGVIKDGRTFFSTGPLKVDKHGKTNFLLLGVAGAQEEGGNLSDSVMLVSLDAKAASLSLLSLPRDLFVASGVGDRKLNEIYAAARYKNKKDGVKGLKVVKSALSEFSGVELHYGAVVNFQIFQEIVDSIGGIDMFVPQDIVDPFYPADNYNYQTFIIRKGKQNLDGETSLKYARSRKTTSDYSRAQRQQDILYGIARKAQEINLLGDPKKMKEFFGIYKQNVVTDINLVEVLALAKVGIGFDADTMKIFSRVLNDDSTQPGGLLYTPAKEFFGGQFVLLPENLEETKLFMHLTLSQPEILSLNPQFSIKNGSKITGQAGRARDRLRRLGFHVIDVGNFESDRPVFQTYAKIKSNEKDFTAVLEKLEPVFNFRVIEPFDETAIITGDDSLVDIEIVLGSTYTEPQASPIIPTVRPATSPSNQEVPKDATEDVVTPPKEETIAEKSDIQKALELLN